MLVGAELFTPSVAAAPLCATPPLTGNTTITGVVNTYYPGLTSIPAGSANTTTTVGTGRGAATPIAVGELVLVVQMQGAQIDSTNADAYGDGVVSATASGFLNNASFIAGQYEYATVASVAGAVIGLNGSGTNGGLLNSYVNANESATQGQQRFQVVRVPQYSSATVSTATPPAAAAWDGSSGGIVVVDVANDLDLNGATIDTTGQGFRAGLQRRRAGATGLANTDYRTATANTANGQKGEGIAGTTKWTIGAADTVGDGYPNGDFGRGAPGNAGGGGTDGNPAANDQNSGGGGGGNAGAGGQGGNSWSSNLARGGHGGAVVVGSGSRAFLGGGGGAGSDNNAVGTSSGGAGGGIVLVRAGSLAGTGAIIADGGAGGVSGQDGSGGGGAGGAVIVLTSLTGAASGIGGLTVTARGGAGGNETHTDQHGPGGGGGGGRVITSSATASTTVTGGANGLHVVTGSAYGATSGGTGASSTTAVIGDAPGTNTGSQCIDVSVSKSAGASPVVPGQTVTYTVVATNNGPYPRSGTASITVTDALPTGLSGATWTCTASSGSNCTASGSGSLSSTANLEVGDSATYTITANLSPTFTGTLSNTATVAGPPLIPELNSTNDSATSAVPAEPRVDLAVTKTDGVASAVPGTNVVYTIVASNTGPATATSALITDSLPSGTTSGTWSCAAGVGGTCGSASGTMPMSTTATLSPAGSVTYTVTVTVASTATGSLANSVTIAAPAGAVETNSANNLATDTDTLTPTADLSISKTDGLTTVEAGTAVTYTIVASNAGPSAITNAAVTDTVPASLTGVTWTCTASAGSSCPASGSGSIAASVDVLPAGSVTFSVDATVVSTATGTLSNTASAALPGGSTDPTPANNSATDTTTITRLADVSITKTDGSATEVPGSSVAYTIVASNAGPSAAVGTTITDTLPGSLSGSTWTCTASAGSTCPASGTGNIATTVDLLPAGTATFTLTATIASTATGSLVNTATAAIAAGVADSTPANNSATDTDTLTPTADLSITKTDGATGEVPGTSVTYTIVASNAGPSTVTGATVTDILPASLAGATWACAASAGSTCPASGSGNISATVTLAPGGTATFTLTSTISTTATGGLVNTATVAVPASVTDPTLANNSATDTDTLTPTGDLSITKTDGAASAIPGQGVTYTIVASNAGPSVINGATVTDSFPAMLTSATWTCSATAGSSCPASGSGNISATVNLAISGTATFTVTASISTTATGSLVNTATVAAPVGSSDPTGANNMSTDTDMLTPRADLSITKTDGLTSQVPGNSATYMIVASNAGPSSAPSSNVTDTLPTALTGATWTCAAAGGATCAASGGGDINTSVDLPVGGTATFTVTGTVAAGATGSLTNTATVSVGAGVTDPVPGNNTATDTDTLTPTADLVVTKTDGATTEVPGTPVTYTIVASNAGPSTITGATVTDTMPAALSGVTSICSATAGSSCPAAGSGSISASVTLLPGGTATFTVTGTIAANATGSLTNTATVALPGGSTDPTPANNSATDTDSLTPSADLSITKTDGVTIEVPGTAATYTIVATNAGPSAVTAVTVTDTMPASLSGVTWTCTAGGAATCPATGSGSISAVVDLPVGGTATFTVTGTVVASATGNLVNTATIAAPVGVTDPTPANNTATDTDTLDPTADLSITKTDGVATTMPGTSVTYTIVVSNAGPSAVTAATVADTMPATLSGATWTCAGLGGGTCLASGSGNINASANLPVGASVTFTVTGLISSAATGTMANSGTVTPPAGVTDPMPANNSATDSDVLIPVADLSITKTDGQMSALPTDPISYVVVATNNGPSAVLGAAVTDLMPAGLVGVAWTCTADLNSACAVPSGSGDIATTVDLAVGESATFIIDATIAASQLGAVTNTAGIDVPPGVVDPDSANNIATDTTVVNGLGDVSIVKTDGASTVVAGTATAYTIVVSNSGPSRIDGVRVIDALPAVLVNATWTCAPSGGALCGAATGTGSIDQLVDLPASSTMTFIVSADVAANAQGTLSNTASVSLPTGFVDGDPTNNQATDLTGIERVADLAVTKTDHVSSLTPGNAVGYDITVVNNGPSAVAGAIVTDVVPAAITGASWTCTPGAGASCGSAVGSGNVLLGIDLAVGASALVHVTGTVSSSATGTLANTAVIAPPAGVTDPDALDNTSTDVDTLAPVADVSVAKSNGVTSQSPGAMSSYTITVTNAGPSAAPGVAVDDPLPSAVTSASWTCSAAAGSSCAAASGSGAINTTVNLAAAGTVTFTMSMQAGPAAGTLTNTARATVAPGITDPDPSNNVASDTDTLVFTADIRVDKTSSVSVVAAGQMLTYTVVVSNHGPDPASDVSVLDTVPAGLAGATWSCAATSGSSCPASGTGDIGATIDLAAGGSATFTMTSTATTSSPATLVNTAAASVGPDTIDPDPTNNTDSATVTVDFTAALSVQKTASISTAKPGDAFFYNIMVSNAGPARLDGVVISDPVPAGIIALSWTCLGAAGAVCSTTSGSGSPHLTAALPSGGSILITLDARVASDAAGHIVNTVTATAGASSQTVTAQATAVVDVSSVVPTNPAITLTKSTAATTYSVVGSVVTFTLVATNTGNTTLTKVTITDPNATVTNCAPATLAPGESLTCSASHVVTQTDLDRGALSNTASVSAMPPTGQAITASSATVVVPATRITALSLEKSSPVAMYAKIGDRIIFTITATNNGNVTLMNVAISDPNAVLSGCAPTTLAPGQTVTCTAVHVVTAADIAARKILNQAHATALPMISLELVCPLMAATDADCPGQVPVSAVSNTVVLNRSDVLPRAGTTMVSKVIAGGGLLGLGGLLLLLGRRRSKR